MKKLVIISGFIGIIWKFSGGEDDSRARRSARVAAKPRTNSVVSLSRRPTLGLYWTPTRVGLKAKPPTGEMRFKRPVQYEAEEELS